MRVLLLEDNRAYADLIARALEYSVIDYRVSICTTLKQGLRKLSSSEYDVALVDLGLPDSSGARTPEAVMAAAPSTAVVVTTGEDFETFGERLIQIGVQDFLPKGDLTMSRVDQALRLARERKEREMAARPQLFDATGDGPCSHDEFLTLLKQATSNAGRINARFAVLAGMLHPATEADPGTAMLRSTMVQVAAVLRGSLRKHDLVACLSDRMIGMLMRDLSEADEAVPRAKVIRQVLQAAAGVHAAPADLRATVGIAFYPQHSDQADSLLAFAIAAANAGKPSLGDPGVHVYSAPR